MVVLHGEGLTPAQREEVEVVARGDGMVGGNFDDGVHPDDALAIMMRSEGGVGLTQQDLGFPDGRRYRDVPELQVNAVAAEKAATEAREDFLSDICRGVARDLADR